MFGTRGRAVSSSRTVFVCTVACASARLHARSAGIDPSGGGVSSGALPGGAGGLSGGSDVGACDRAPAAPLPPSAGLDADDRTFAPPPFNSLRLRLRLIVDDANSDERRDTLRVVRNTM